MTTIKDALLKTFNPVIAIKVVSIDDKPIEDLVNNILDFVRKEKYESILDQSTNAIYLGKKAL